MWISHGDKWASRCTYTDATGLNLEDGVLLMQNRGPDRGHVLVYENGGELAGGTTQYQQT